MASTYMLTYHIWTPTPQTHLRSLLPSNYHLPLDLVFLSLYQSHNSSSFIPCLILIKILPQSLVLLTYVSPHEFSPFLKLQQGNGFSHLYIPTSFPWD